MCSQSLTPSLVGTLRRRVRLQLSELEGGDEKASAAKEGKPAVSYEIAASKEKAILAPEEVFFEGPPSWTEMVIPGISILTVIGIVPFIATATRQAWVKYKITSRRISVTSGFNGQVPMLGGKGGAATRKTSIQFQHAQIAFCLPASETLKSRAQEQKNKKAPFLAVTLFVAFCLFFSCDFYRWQDLTEVTYDEIFGMKFVYRGFGATGDVVIELRDGAKLEVKKIKL